MPSSVTPLAEDERAFLQQRVALFGRATLGIVLFAVAVVLLVNVRRLSHVAPPLASWATLGTAASAGMWLLCRKGRRSARLCRAIEAGGLLVYALGFLAMGRYVFIVALPRLANALGLESLPTMPQALIAGMGHMGLVMVMAFALTYIFVLRAALVPSPPQYTALVTAAGGLPLGLTCADSVPGASAEELFAAAAPAMRPALGVVGTGMVWWLFTMVVCMVISQIIYGLRREVREAKQLGQYAIDEQLGEGGMGVVYRAHHALLRRPTAIKLLPPEKAGESSIARFEREVRLTARLTHPNTVTVYDYGRTPEGVFYYAMELLDGATLEAVVEVDGPQPEERVLKVLSEVTAALTEAHANELIHRDIKPANIILCTLGGQPDVAKLLDFGLVKHIDPDGDAELQLTREGAITGTPTYLAPENLIDPERVDARADLYAVGAVGYYLLTGSPVFTGRTVVEVCGHHLHTEPEPPSKRLGRPVDPALEQILLDCLSKDPAARPPSALALRERLIACAAYGSWTDAEARGWWDKLGTAVRARQEQARASAHGATVAVDLAEPRRGV
jgi:serine/threonine-protein kinase